jgi:hypothetical protein
MTAASGWSVASLVMAIGGLMRPLVVKPTNIQCYCLMTTKMMMQ